ncbi:TSUP family transporter [bacterium]|nr:TSUP family transporter [bacterium]
MFYLLYALIGIAAGMLGGFVGVGGGIIIVPALVFLAGYSQIKAQGTSLAILLPPIGLLGFLQYMKNPETKIDLVAAGIIALFFALGAHFGGKLANSIEPSIVRKSFAILMFVTSFMLFFKK